MHLDLKGLVAAVFTPFDSSGELNLNQIERQAEALVSRGVIGAFICGTTGEGQTLSSEERRQVAQRWKAVAPADFAVIVHIGHVSLAEAKLLAQHAANIGVSAIAAMAPYFYKPMSLDDVVACSAEVAAAAPQTPFYYYHFPSITGIAISAAQYLQAAAPRIGNLAGLKFTDDNLYDLTRALSLFGDRMDLFLGREGMMLGALASGARAAIGSTLNFASPTYLRIIEAFEAGNLASAHAAQKRANAMLAVIARFGGMRAIRAAMNLVGPDCGPPRLPLRPLEGAELVTLRKELDAVEFSQLTQPAKSPAR